MKESAMPLEDARTFLLARRGIPLGLAFLALTFAMLEPHGRGWYLLIAIACGAEVLPTFKSGQDYLQARSRTIRWDGYWVRALRPIARLMGREEAWLLSFCAWNNHRVHQSFAHRKARKALVLLPHCIQMARCKAPVLENLQSCYTCGLCPVGDVLEAHLIHHWDTRISNRSHKAYREAREFRPDLILAVSCVDRLLKGLTRLNEIPSFAIPLSLPHGMCVDTQFEVSRLVQAMEQLVEPKAVRDSKIQHLQRQGIA